jgi:hypothetical protein
VIVDARFRPYVRPLACLLLVVALLSLPMAQAGQDVMILLDSSYSMREPIEGGMTKMQVAKKVILEVVQKAPKDTRIGLRIYGNDSNGFTACRATKLMVPMGYNTQGAIANALLSVKPTGATPISYAIRTSLRDDFIGATLNAPAQSKQIVLVSDGMETCSVDPCDMAVQLVRTGIDVKINVVGFGLQEYDAEKQLKCVALSTFGKYYDAKTAAELSDGLGKAIGVQKDVSGRVLIRPTSPGSSTYPVQPGQPTGNSSLPPSLDPLAPGQCCGGGSPASASSSMGLPAVPPDALPNSTPTVLTPESALRPEPSTKPPPKPGTKTTTTGLQTQTVTKIPVKKATPPKVAPKPIARSQPKVPVPR